MNGNITKQGIKLDLDWMKGAGLGGFQSFNAAMGVPKVVDKPLAFMTPEWKDAFRYATEIGEQLGFEEAIAGSPGWSESGGPWVKPSEGMKKMVWSETVIEGGQHFTGILPKPPSISAVPEHPDCKPHHGNAAARNKKPAGVLRRFGCHRLPYADSYVKMPEK